MRRITLSLLAGVVVVLTGCSSMDKRAEAVDMMRIAQVESAAKAVGVQVYWVNYPTKVVASN